MWVPTLAFAQEVPEGDFESSGEYTGWTVVSGAPSLVDEFDSGLQGSRAVQLDRYGNDLILCSAAFTVTRVSVSAMLHNPYSDGGGTDWWVQDAASTVLATRHDNPSQSTNPYSSHTLDVSAACGVSVHLCVEPDAYRSGDYDDLHSVGDPCPDFQDTDGDGYCPIGQDLDTDGDCDGAGEFDAPAEDCDEASFGVHTGAEELCNSIDDDCDDVVDDAPDLDVDSYDACVDCDDGYDSIHPGALELCDDIDQDCNGVPDDAPDGDGDGFGACDECDDQRADVSPGEAEVCDGVDQDCDELVDEGVMVVTWPDRDGDGYGADDGQTQEGCEVPTGRAVVGGDCDDRDDEVYPGAEDPPDDGLDRDCDGSDGAAPALGDRSAAEPVGPVGCACDGSPGAGLVPLLATGAALRSRRRPSRSRSRPPVSR